MAKIPYEVKGGSGSDRAIIFIHGFLDEGKVWDRVIDRLTVPEYCTVTLDLPGMGGANDWNGAFDLRTLTDAVISVMDEVGKPAVLVGHSMGCQIAELVAVGRPGRILGMALVAPIPLKGLPVDEQTTAAMHSVGGNEEINRVLRKQFSPELSDERIEELVLIGMKVKPPVAGTLFDVWSSGDPAGNEPCPVDVPVAIFGGDLDPFTPPDVIQSTLVPRFTQCKVETLKDSSHWAHVSDPAFIAARLNPFINQL